MMGMVRCNVPSVFMYGGAALPGRFGERDVTIRDSYEAVDAVLAGAMDEATLARLERSCLPTIGACAGAHCTVSTALAKSAKTLSPAVLKIRPMVRSLGERRLGEATTLWRLGRQIRFAKIDRMAGIWLKFWRSPRTQGAKPQFAVWR